MRRLGKILYLFCNLLIHLVIGTSVVILLYGWFCVPTMRDIMLELWGYPSIALLIPTAGGVVLYFEIKRVWFNKEFWKNF